MKYVVVLADGMADEQISRLGNKTPLEYAYTPNMAKIAPYSEIGMVRTIPNGCAKGSDTANLSVLGYDPKKYYFGRSPLEALSMGVKLAEKDTTFRVNLITVSEEEEDYNDKKILDHSSDEITTEEAQVLMGVIQDAFGDTKRSFYPGISYRHLLVWDEGSTDVKLTPPHDILGRKVEQYKPTGEGASYLWDITKKSYDILNQHPINVLRRKRGLKPANSIWIWGEGIKPKLPSFKEKYKLSGAVISAVDLIKGIGIGSEMVSIDVKGATGNFHTNYEGKTKAALKWLLEENGDFVYIHLEGPDECGHRGELENKIKAIEWIDEKIIGPLLQTLEASQEDYKIMILPDHPTPVSIRTHTDDAVPFLIYKNTNIIANFKKEYGESYAKATRYVLEEGHQLMEQFLDQ
ncbi:MAG: cofactor-independent phosphoglycerate mutase [Cellulosilyticaceae bacterium]